MRLVLRVLGLELIDLDFTTEAPAEDDTARDLSGGTTVAYSLETGPTDRYMGFGNGLADGDD